MLTESLQKSRNPSVEFSVGGYQEAEAAGAGST
jgi:hypothetical protein